jgi:hypothetical protein
VTAITSHVAAVRSTAQSEESFVRPRTERAVRIPSKVIEH